jgi:cyclase
VLARRIIACLDVRDGIVVKGVQFEGLRRAGEPAALARRYVREGADEVVLLDVTATVESRRALATTIEAAARDLFIPLVVGGGIRSIEDAVMVVEAGADKVSVNSAAIRRPALIGDIARRYGRQAVVVAIDAKWCDGRPRVFSQGGARAESCDAIAWAREAESRGAGEILLTSIDRDGTLRGFDCDLTAAVSSAVGIPVIASGGAGRAEDFVEVFAQGRADAAIAASIFHDRLVGIADVKRALTDAGMAVRREMVPAC